MPGLGQRAKGRDERRAANTDAITAATRALLAARESYADLSVEQITARAGISRSAFYDHFRDKRDLLIKLLEEAAGSIRQEADELIGGRPSGPNEIPFTIEAALAFARDSRDVFAASMEAASYDPVVSAYWRDQFLDRFIDVIEARIRSQQDRGVALPIAPRPAATSLVLMVTQTLYHHVISDGSTTDQEIVDTLVTIAVRTVYGPVDAATGN